MWFWLISTVIVSLVFLYKRKSSSRNAQCLQKPNYKKDVVYLVQFPCSPFIRTISPFALKLETYLRMRGISYEPIYSLKFSRKGQIPYIELNGEQIPDSNVIIKELERRKLVSPDDHLSQDQLSLNHLIQITLENHTSAAVFHWRYGFHMEEFFRKLCAPYYPNKRSMNMFRFIQPYVIRLKSRMHGIGRHSLDEVAKFSFDDLTAISRLLGDKPFFNGDLPSTIDCTAFGHLVQMVFLPMDTPQKKFIKDECKNLEEFVDRMRTRFWPDWDEMCSGDCMEGRKAESIKL